MIVVDTSAVVAIVFGEIEATAFDTALRTSASSRISAVSVLEAELVIRGRKSESIVADVRNLLKLRTIQIIPFDDAQAHVASNAYKLFGKGFHAARLNMGDCAAYALAKSLNAPLLYKGEDFARTDIVSALTPG